MRLWPSLLAFALLAGCSLPNLGSSSSGSPEPVRSEEIGLIGEWKGEVVEIVTQSDSEANSAPPQRTPLGITFGVDKKIKITGPKTSSTDPSLPEILGRWTVMGGAVDKPAKAELAMDMGTATGRPSGASDPDEKPEVVTITFQLTWESDNDVIMTPTSGVSSTRGQLKDRDLQGAFHMSRVLN